MSRGKAIRDFLVKSFKPESAWDAAMTYGPDAGFALLSAATAPGGFNPVVGLEDLGISLLGSAGSRVVGGFAGQRLFPNDPDSASRVRMVADMAITAPLSFMAPRPALMAAAEKAAQGQAEQQALLQQQSEQELQQQLATAMLGGGLMATPGLYGNPGLAMNTVM